MIKYYGEIIGTPILDYDNGSLLGLIEDIIINPDNGKIEAFWVKPATLPISNGVIQVKSILEWKKSIYLKSEREISEPADVVRVAEILNKNTVFIENNVRNEAGDYLGKVYDLDFDTKNYYLRNIYSQKGFFIFKYQQRIFSYNNILNVLPDYILVKDVVNVKEKKTAILKTKEPLLDA